MSSPFRYFRKHTKAFMAIAAVLAIFIFVVGDAIQGSSRSPGGRDAGATVATWNGGTINEAELQTLVQQRRMVDGFLKGIFAAGGGRSIFDLPPPSSVPFLLITDDRPEAIEADVVGIEVFSDLADEAGITVSDRMINDYIEEMGLKKVTEEQVRQVLGSMGDHNVSQNVAIVFSMLRKMLQAQFYQMTFGDAARVVLPQQRWEDWRKVNERISVQAAVLPVEKFISKVPEPTEDQLLGFYNDHKDQPADQYVQVGDREMPTSTIGFTEPRRIQLHYLLGSITDRTQQLLATVTEEEIADYYERNKRSEFLKLDTSSDFPAEPSNDQPASPAGEAGASEAETPAADAAGAPAAEADSTPPAEAPAAEATPATPPAAEGPAEPAEAADEAVSPPTDPAASEPATSSEPTEPTEPAASEPATPAEPAAGGEGSSQNERTSPFRLVSFQEDASEQATGESAAGSEASQNPPPASDSSAPAAESSDAPATSDATAPAAAPAADAPAADAADASGGAGAAAETPGVEPAMPETEQYEPLDKVRDDIRQRVATVKAVEELQNVTGEATAQLQSEFNQYARSLFEAREAKKKAPPVPAKLKDLTWLAERYGLKYEKTTPLTAREMFDTIVGKAADSNQQQNVTQAMFMQLERYEPFLAKELEGDRYVVAKLEDAPSRTPKFKEIRDQVVEAWKRQEAAKLAEAEAKKLADEVQKSPAPFDQFFFADRGYDVVKETQFFSWLRYPAGRMGEGGRPALSDVPELTNVGPEFMEAAFGLQGNEAVGLLNFDHSAAYVIRLNRRQWSEQELQQLFLEEEPGWAGRQDMFAAHESEFRQLFQQQMLDERAGFEYDPEYLKRRREALQQ